MKSSVFHLEVNGATMAVHQWLPEGEVVGMLQVSHGMAEHGGRYAALAQSLTDHGWMVIAGDHRGHGQTATVPSGPGTAVDADPLGTLGHFADHNGWRSVVDDLRSVALHATTQHPGVPHVLLGHSMGSLLARDYASQYSHDLAGLVLSGTPRAQGLIGSAARVMARNLVRARGPKSRAHLLHKLTFGSYNSAFKPNRTDFDWLSRDTAVVDAYVADPRCGFVCTNALYVDLIGGLARVNDRKTMKGTGKKLAILVLTGSMDPAGGERAALALKAFYKGIGNKHVQVNTYKGARHEVYNDTNRGSVVHDLVGWLDGRLAKRKAS